jgi:hypothetical protein
MERPTMLFGFRTPLLLWCAAAFLGLSAGCRRQDLGDYQTFKQKQEAGYDPTASFTPEDKSSLFENEPLPAELEREPEALLEPPVDALAPVNLADVSNAADILRANAKISAASEPAAATAAASAEGPRKVAVLVPQREFRPEGPQKALRITYDDLDLLKVLNMDPVTPDAVSLMPNWLRNLDGKAIRIRGFMFPTFESTGIERFVLARDAEKCCFGPNAKVYDLIAVEMKPGKTCDYIHLRPFDVIGTLRIDLQVDGDVVLGLYRIEDAELVLK